MAVGRLEVRLDQGRRRKLQELAAEHGAPVSEMVRRLIDRAYEDTQGARRKRAAQELGRLEIENVPDLETLKRQLEAVHESGGVH